MLECAMLAWPIHAAASQDYFNTEQALASGAGATAPLTCPPGLIDQELKLTDVVELALCNNPQTHALWASSRIRAAQLGASMANYLPTLSSPISLSRDLGNSGSSSSASISLSASYLLYDFGGRDANVGNARQLLVAANATRDATLQSLYLSAVQGYFDLLSARASVVSSHAAEEAAEHSLAAAKARYDAGTATPVDRLQAQTALSQATLDRIRAEGNATSAQGALASIMGYPASQPYRLAPIEFVQPDKTANQNIGQLIDQAMHDRPDLQAAEAQVKAAEAGVSATRANGLPSISLRGSLSHARTVSDGLTSSSNSRGVGVTLSVPLFNGYRDTYNDRAALAQLDSSKADHERIANQIALDVWQAYQTLLTNSQALLASNDLLDAAQESENMASGRYKAGVGTILDVLTAQSTLASARQQHDAARYAFLASKFALAQAIGQLDVDKAGTLN